MKKVLIISYYFPPRPDIGSRRPFGIAKYLHKFNWEPIILTAKLPGSPPIGIKVIETEDRDNLSIIKSKIGFDSKKGLHDQLGIETSKNFNYPSWKSKSIKLAKEIINYPDEQRGWYKFAFNAASKFLLKEKVDAIISTSYPVTSHLIARKLKQKHKIPWIADLRDPWSQNPYLNKFRIIKYLEKRLEIKTLFDADVLVTVTDPWIKTLTELHKNKKIICVTNGYDSEDCHNISSKLTNKFTITYTGILHNGKRDPSLLFKLVAQLIKENKIDKDLMDIRFYGPKEDWLIEEINKHNLEGVANLYGFVTREEAILRQRESQVLLLILWNNKNEEGFCPGKVYEYFCARRPILAVGWHGSVVKDLLEITNAGRLAGNSSDLRKIFLEYYQEFVRFSKVKCRSNHKIDAYTFNSIAKKYSQILNGLFQNESSRK